LNEQHSVKHAGNDDLLLFLFVLHDYHLFLMFVVFEHASRATS
jgi:hypothetical protein